MSIFSCLEFVTWKPTRRMAIGRHPTQQVVGITNYDKCLDKYWLITELDTKSVKPEDIVERAERLGYKIAYILETAKGYHIYWLFSHDNPRKIYHTCMKLSRRGLADKHHCKLIKSRGGDEQLRWKAILRISPKYEGDKILIAWMNTDTDLPTWHVEVLMALNFAHSRRWRCKMWPEAC